MKFKLIQVLLLSLSIISISACSDAKRSAMAAWGKKHKVTMYSGGKEIRSWITTGKIENEQHSNGYYFRDEATGNIVMVDGDVIIEIVD